LKKYLFVCTVLVFILQANTSQLAFIVLNTANWGKGRLPSDWQIKVNHGKPELSVCANAESCLHLKSVRSSFALEHSVDVDLAQMPYLTWNWKVAQLPPGADFRHARSDDQAAQVLVAFQDRRVITYIWDSTAPKGLVASAPAPLFKKIFAVVMQSGTQNIGTWITEHRNMIDDYKQAYGEAPEALEGVRIQINSQHTQSRAEAYWRSIAVTAQP